MNWPSRPTVYGSGVVTWATRSMPSVPGSFAAAALHRVEIVGRADGAGDRAGVADHAGEAAGVDAGDAGDAVAAQHRVEVALRVAVARPAGQLAHHDAAAEQAAGLEVGRVHAVVADVRVRERDDLAGVARIGEDLLVAAQRGVEHDLAGRRRRDSDARHRSARLRTPTRRRARAPQRLRACSCGALYVHSSLCHPVDHGRDAVEHRVAHSAAQVAADVRGVVAAARQLGRHHLPLGGRVEHDEVRRRRRPRSARRGCP